MTQKPEAAGEREPARHEVWRMFDRIAHRYDPLNRLLSLGQDVRWRNRVARYLPARDRQRVLDLATGTADQLLALFTYSDKVVTGTGIDMAEKMLEIGRRKVSARGWDKNVTLQVGDAARIPFEEATFDAVTISFGIRNVVDVGQSLREMCRVLRPGGRALVLEFSMPRSAWVRGPYLLYLRHVLPRLGGFLSGDPKAYRYLNQTVESFPWGEAFCNLMTEAGLVRVQAHPLTLGVATLYQGDKEEAGATEVPQDGSCM